MFTLRQDVEGGTVEDKRQCLNKPDLEVVMVLVVVEVEEEKKEKKENKKKKEEEEEEEEKKDEEDLVLSVLSRERKVCLFFL
ncbi:hypothetical protein M8J77_019227 [Diaphorina citri]|nr:hypothetical protein M8J77_019227 [Diaphorina citri]